MVILMGILIRIKKIFRDSELNSDPCLDLAIRIAAMLSFRLEALGSSGACLPQEGLVGKNRTNSHGSNAFHFGTLDERRLALCLVS